MAVSIVQSTAYTGTVAQTNMTFTLGATPTVGNWLFLAVCYWTGDNPLVTPSGWTLVRKDENGQVGIGFFQRSVQSGDGTSWNVTVLTANDQNSGFMLEVAGANTVQPVYQSSNASSGVAATSIASTAITPQKIGMLPVAFTVTITGATGDVATISGGWAKLQFANSTFQPAWMWGLSPTATQSDNSSVSNTVSNLPSAQCGTSVYLIQPGGSFPGELGGRKVESGLSETERWR